MAFESASERVSARRCDFDNRHRVAGNPVSCAERQARSRANFSFPQDWHFTSATAMIGRGWPSMSAESAI